MILLNPRDLGHESDDERTRELMRETVEFFEAKGKRRLLEDYYYRGWYADFLEYAKDHRLLATMFTPEGECADNTEEARWDTWRVCQFA